MSRTRRARRVAGKYRRRRTAGLVLAVALLISAPLLFDGLRVQVGPLETLKSRVFGEPQGSSPGSSSESSRGPASDVDWAEKAATGVTSGGWLGGGSEEASASQPDLIQPSPAAASYAAVAPALPGVKKSSVGGTFQSTDDPSWAVTGIKAPGQDDYYTVYSQKVEDGWKAKHSVLADNPDYPQKGRAPLVDLPEDLQAALYPESSAEPAASPEDATRNLASDSPYLGDKWRPVSLRQGEGFAEVRLEKKGSEGYTHAYLRRYEDSWYAVSLGRSLTAAELPDFPDTLVESGSLPDAGPAMVPVSEPVIEGNLSSGDDRRERVESGMEDVRETVDDYEGTAGLYVRDVEGDWGYGIRPDERFYTASVIKIPVMAAVYSRVESGELSLSQTIATKDRDYAGGAGGLQWQEDSVSHTVEDYLWMMIKQSDNVATNVLVRAVGGPEYVNEVARDLGAGDTMLRQKVTDQRAAAPGLDNYTTPRDMAAILGSIAAGEAANEEHTKAMLALMRLNGPESWVGEELPPEAEPACKVGWIGGVYNDICLVQSDDGPYIISVFSKYGPPQVVEGSSTLNDISARVWEIQNEDPADENKGKEDGNGDKNE